MTLRTLKTVLLVSLLAFVLAACGGDDDAGGNNTPPANNGNTGTVDLPQTITTTDDAGGVLTVSYPAGWFAQEFSGSVVVGNDEEVFTSDAAQLPSGQTIGTILALPTAMLGVFGLPENPSTADVLANFMENTRNEDPDAQFTFGEPQTLTLNGKQAALQSGTGTDANGTSDVVVIVVETGAGFVLVSFTAPENEAANFDAQVRGIAGSVDFIMPEAEG